MSIEDILKNEGYYDLKDIPGKGVCGLMRFLFTVGLCYGLDVVGYKGRYCFENSWDAKAALNEWDGVGDPPGNWIKHKGKTEYSNPNKTNQ